MNIITYKDKKYSVIPIIYNGIKVPVVLDYIDYEKILEYKKQWYITKHNMVACIHNKKEIYMHDIVIRLSGKQGATHINKIGFDNRRCNLGITNKNIRKKKRIIEIPGIDSNILPTFVWYLKPDNTHGERFFVNINNFKYKTPSSVKLSLRYKLEVAKKYIRKIKEKNPALFQLYSMNGDFNKEGQDLVDEFYDIINLAGYKATKIDINNNTDRFLKEDLTGLTDEEIYLLEKIDFF